MYMEAYWGAYRGMLEVYWGRLGTTLGPRPTMEEPGSPSRGRRFLNALGSILGLDVDYRHYTLFYNTDYSI